MEKTLGYEIVCLNKFYKFAFSHFLTRCIFFIQINKNIFGNEKIQFFDQNMQDMKETSEFEIFRPNNFYKFAFTHFFKLYTGWPRIQRRYFTYKFLIKNAVENSDTKTLSGV